MRADAPPVPPALLQAVYDHAAAAAPRECCGLLLGPRGGALDEVRPCTNELGDGPSGREAYSLGLQDLCFLDASLRGPRPAQVLYHSHVDAPPVLSAADERLALLGGDEPTWPLAHLVVEVRSGRSRRARLFAWDPRGRGFAAVAEYAETGAPP